MKKSNYKLEDFPIIELNEALPPVPGVRAELGLNTGHECKGLQHRTRPSDRLDRLPEVTMLHTMKQKGLPARPGHPTAAAFRWRSSGMI